MTTSSINTTAAAATHLVVTTEPPNPGTVTAGGAFGLKVTAEDAFNNPVMTFGSNGETATVSLASNPGGLSYVPVTVPFNSGVADFSGLLSLTIAASGYTFRVSSTTNTNLTGDTSTSVTVIPAAASQVVLVTQPAASIPAGSLFGFTAKVEDQFGNTVTGYSGTVTASAAPGNNLGGAAFTPVTVPINALGLADFTGLLSLSQPASNDALQLTSAGLFPVTTNPFSISSATATQLMVTSGPLPPVATAGGNISLTVAAEDPFGNVVPNFSGNVSVMLTNNSTGAVLGGLTTVGFVNGVATFTGLNVNLVGSGYTFQVSSGTLPIITSSAFSVQAAQATQLLVTTPFPINKTVGSTFNIDVQASTPSGTPP